MCISYGCAGAPPGRLYSGRVRGAARVAQLGANDRSRPATPSHTGPRDTWSDGTSSHVCHHSATLRDCLTVKQVHRESVLGFADPRRRRHRHHRPGRCRAHQEPGAEPATPARPPAAAVDVCRYAGDRIVTAISVSRPAPGRAGDLDHRVDSPYGGIRGGASRDRRDRVFQPHVPGRDPAGGQPARAGFSPTPRS